MTAGGGQEDGLWGRAVFLGEKMAPVYGFGMRRVTGGTRYPKPRENTEGDA